MAENLTDEESHRLSPDSYDTTSLLRAVDAVDKLRSELSDKDFGEPPSLRTDLLLLHQLAMRVINEGYRDKSVVELFDLLNGISDQVFEIAEALEQIQEAIEPLAELYPESLDYDSLSDD